MIFYDEYSDVPKETIERFVTDQQLGRLVTVSDSVQPHIGLYPSVDPGSWLMEAVAAHPDLQGLRRKVLVTRDAHGLYEKFGFRPLARPAGYMELHRPDVYAQGHTKGDGGQSLN